MFEYGVGIRNPLFFVGIVENNIDPLREGRVQVRAFGIHGTNRDIPTEDLPWAICIKGDYDPNGSPGVGLPHLNAWVFGFFLDGRDAQQPMVLGLIPKKSVGGRPNPRTDGVGADPVDQHDLASGAPGALSNLGQPESHAFTRGENISETTVLEDAATRVRQIRVAGDPEGNLSWDQPVRAYATQYPFNRVWATRHHTIELDDSPGGERITIRHSSGSYVEMDNGGTVTNNSAGDMYDIVGRRQNVYVGGPSIVTIDGHAHVYVRGNKTEEIEGNLEQIVHGHYHLGVGGQATINASEEVQVRGADVAIDANVGTLSIFAGRELQTQAGTIWVAMAPKMHVQSTEVLNIKSINTFFTTEEETHIKTGTGMFLQVGEKINLKAENFTTEVSGIFEVKADEIYIDGNNNLDLLGRSVLRMGSDGFVHIEGTTVYIDDNVSMANGSAESPSGAQTAEDATDAEEARPAGRVEAPEPPPKSMALEDVLSQSNGGATGSGGISSEDDDAEAPAGGGGGSTGRTTGFQSSGGGGGPGGGSGGGSGRGGGGFYTNAPATAAMQNAVTPLLDLIALGESRGNYEAVVWAIPSQLRPTRRLTEMTIQEILDYQESVDEASGSEALGRYQFVEDTLRGYNNQRFNTPQETPVWQVAGLSLSDLFNEVNQDKLALARLRFRGFDRWVAGQMSDNQFHINIANEWASLPMPSGKGAYDGDGLNSASDEITVLDVQRVLREVKSRYAALGGLGGSSAPPGDPTTTGPQ